MPYRTPHPPTDATGPARHLVLCGGIGLAAIAGYVNVVVLGAFAVPVSHMSGAVSRLGVDVATGNLQDVRLILLIIGGFLAGAALSGAIIGGHQLRPGRRYGVALMAEGLALSAAAALLRAGVPAGVPTAAIACGIQNGMASSYYGLIIRTTHVSGIVTDLGVLLGQRLRGTPIARWKPVLLAGVLVGFLLGGVAGQLMLGALGPTALAPAAGTAMLAGIGYFAWRTRARWRARNAPQPDRPAAASARQSSSTERSSAMSDGKLSGGSGPKEKRNHEA